MQLPKMTEYREMRVLTTSQIAEMYGTDSKTISYNFSYNKKKYGEGKHYIKLEGAELKAFKASREIPDCHKYSAHLYLWTEKGALLHAKSLNTDKAWEAYEYLVDFYFRAKENIPKPQETKPEPVQNVEPTEKRSYYFAKPRNPIQSLEILLQVARENNISVHSYPFKAYDSVLRNNTEKRSYYFAKPRNPIQSLEILLQVARENNISVHSYPFKAYDSVLRNNVIGIRNDVTVEKACYELAYELSHAFIHYDGGDLIKSPLSKEYNRQAERAAEMIIKMLNVKLAQA